MAYNIVLVTAKAFRRIKGGRRYEALFLKPLLCTVSRFLKCNYSFTARELYYHPENYSAVLLQDTCRSFFVKWKFFTKPGNKFISVIQERRGENQAGVELVLNFDSWLNV